MRTFLRILSAECMKITGFRTWLLILLSPLVSLPIGALSDMQEDRVITWQVLLSTMSAVHALLFLPVLSGLFAALICRNEHSDGGWKQLLALPVTRTSVYFAKFVLIIALLGAVQLLFLAGVLGVGWYRGQKGSSLGATAEQPVRRLVCLPAAGCPATGDISRLEQLRRPAGAECLLHHS